MARLRFGEWVCDVEDSLLDAASPRCRAGVFLAEAGSAPRLWLKRRPLGTGGHPFQAGQPALGGFAVEGDTVLTDAPLSLFPAEFALRALYQLAVLRQGGLCVHGAGVVFGAAAVVALGPSGAGKSTLARLCFGSGRAGLLSDELVALLPEGRVLGSPFSSEADLPATRSHARLHALLLLEKGPVEALAPVRPSDLLAALLGQRFRGAAELEPGASVLGTAGAVVDAVPGFRLTFRKDAAVAGFLDGWVHGETAPLP